MAKKPIKITEVVLRDAHQSLLATRMTMDEMRPILPEMDKIPYFSVECWGGATFDSCIRFLDEDPWERLRILRKELPHQKLQMLFRGQNMLGYRPYADDAVEYFVQKSVANGIDVIRIFDALNDPRNLQTAIKAANKEGAHVQACISYTLSPVHNNEYFANYAKTLEEMGADSICIKDMAGLLKPYTCYELVSELKKTVKIPVDIHSHYTAGLASMSILKGIEAGADIVDTAMSPLALGTSHMPTESLVAALQGTDYDTGLDLKQLNVVRAYFAKLREKYIANGQISPKSLGVDANTLLYQVPGGMLSNLLKQLKDAGKEDQLDAVLQELGPDVSLSRKSLSGMVSVSVITDTLLLEVVITSTDPDFACKVAGAFAKVAPTEIVRITKAGGVKIVDQPEIPTDKASPRTVFDTAIGVIIGVMVAAVIVILRTLADTTIYLLEDIENMVGITVLGQIPDINSADDNYAYWTVTEEGAAKNEKEQ